MFVLLRSCNERMCFLSYETERDKDGFVYGMQFKPDTQNIENCFCNVNTDF